MGCYQLGRWVVKGAVPRYGHWICQQHALAGADPGAVWLEPAGAGVGPDSGEPSVVEAQTWDPQEYGPGDDVGVWAECEPG